MENRASRYSLPENFKSIKGRVLASGSALLTTALLACSSGDANTSPGADGTDLEPTNTPGVSIRAPGTGGDERIIMSPTEEPTPAPILTPEQKTLINYANRQLKPEFQFSNIGEVKITPPDNRDRINYSIGTEIGGYPTTLSRTVGVDGSLHNELILIEGLEMAEVNEVTVIDLITHYFNASQADLSGVTKRARTDGTQLFEKVVDNPDGSYNTWSAYAQLRRGTNNFTIGLGACHKAPADLNFASRSCFG